jgi:hypothetical protein
MMPRTALTLLGLAVLAPRLPAREPPRILDVRTQEVDRITYFQVRIEPPADLRLPGFDTRRPFSEADRRNFARLPQLVPTDGKTRAVYYRYKSGQPQLSFFGQTLTDGKAAFVLQYPLEETSGKDKLTLAELVRSPGMAEVPLEVDFATARKVPIPPAADPSDLHVSLDDLRGLWALHQAAHFAVLETQVLDFNFYSFAREATSRKYGVLGSPWVKRQLADPEHRLYEITTGADAVAETLQLHRLLHPEARDRGERSIDIERVRAITVPEQPFEKMLAGRRPDVEPIARLTPRDNWYVHFKSIAKFIEAGDLLDEWGTNITRVYEVRSRDYRLRERYEKQLCLRSTVLAKTLGPALVKSLAVTGSDPYLREGTDITVIFQVADRALFLGAMDVYLKEAREAHRDQLREGKDEYRKVTIESFVTPLREVSLHRAVLDEYVVYSNSPAAIRRIIDTHQGLTTALAGSADFQYMRTVFPLGDREEEGFVFLSDAFIRRLVGPASRIKERRRLEALTSLQMLTNAALFHAWETGKLPADHGSALAGAGLKPADIAIPDGKVLTWDAKQQLAISDVFNTMHFATPLIELPIDKVTPQEEQEYSWFRDHYMKLWTGYFDPIAMRYTLDSKRIRAETHILPVVGTPIYRSLASLPLGKMPGKALPSTVAELAVNADVNQELRLTFHVDEDVLLRAIIERLIRWEADPRENAQREYEQAFWKLPVAIGLHAPKEIPEQAQVVMFLQQYLGDGRTRNIRHKGMTITEIPVSAERYGELVKFVENAPKEDLFGTVLSLVPTKEAPKALYAVIVDKALYVTPNAELPKRLIDQALAKKDDNQDAAPQRDINVRLTLSPENARQAAGLLFEYEDHCLSLLNNQVWNCFYQTGILAPDAPEKTRLVTARQFLGYVPVGPSGSAYERDPKTGEMVNRRHGTYRRPMLHTDVENDSDLGRFLNQLRTIRAELRFQDNGIHAWLTVDRK